MRGSGRTTSSLLRLMAMPAPTGRRFYVVHSQAFAAYCRALLQHLGHRHDGVVFVLSRDVSHKLRGIRGCPVVFDHSAYLGNTNDWIDESSPRWISSPKITLRDARWSQ